MTSTGPNSVRSPNSSQTNSYDRVSGIRPSGRAYQTRSSITEETSRDDHDYEGPTEEMEEPTRVERPPAAKEDQYIQALQHRFRDRPKTDYSYSRLPAARTPVAPPLPSTPKTVTPTTTTPATSISATRTGSYSPTIRPGNTDGASTPDTNGYGGLPRPVLRRVAPDQQNSYARSIAADLEAKERARAGVQTTTTTPSTGYQPRANSSGLNVRINEQKNQEFQEDPSRSNLQTSPATNAQLSIFEKIPQYGGPVSYLGTATFSQFEHCLRECLERERRQTGMLSQITRQDLPSALSGLEYGHDDLFTSSYHGYDPARVHTFDDYPSRPLSTYAMDDIRYINAALSRSGIPLFPYYETYSRSSSPPILSTSHLSPYPCRRYGMGPVVSACQVADEDPALLFSRNGPLAVQKVWNALRNTRPNSFSRGLYDY